MATKANKIRAAARKRIAENQKQSELEVRRSDNREILLTAESKAMLEDMRALGFCPPKGTPSIKQYSRYAAFRNSQAATTRAQVIADDAAIIASRGGVVELIYQRLADPKLKDTAFAQLTALLQRSLSMAPVLVDENQHASLGNDSVTTEDGVLDLLASEFGVTHD
ncbi:Uncharacterised protein [Serratia quinivorans]|uniref:hypothetical protein n=1 Tax=Serratia quinivorans TaxID=137545 RepID=UPI00217A61C5|nr:hypothetical protein [Serratia quinivorans]CAI1768441.1 Uncharacterised protein [Serratia quinivorans]